MNIPYLYGMIPMMLYYVAILTKVMISSQVIQQYIRLLLNISRSQKILCFILYIF